MVHKGSISSTFYEDCLADILLPKITWPKCNREKLREALLNEKRASKMLMKLTAGVNFINILRANFAPIFLRQKLQS